MSEQKPPAPINRAEAALQRAWEEIERLADRLENYGYKELGARDFLYVEKRLFTPGEAKAEPSPARESRWATTTFLCSSPPAGQKVDFLAKWVCDYCGKHKGAHRATDWKCPKAPEAREGDPSRSSSLPTFPTQEGT